MADLDPEGEEMMPKKKSDLKQINLPQPLKKYFLDPYSL